MLKRVWFRLTIAFLLVAIIGISMVAVLANRATSAGFNRYLAEESTGQVASLQNELVAYYSDRGSWSGVETVLRDYRSVLGSGVGLTLLDARGQTVATAGSGRGNRPRDTDLAGDLPIEVDGQEVGRLIVEGPPGMSMMASHAGQQFLGEVNQAIVWAGLIAVAVALILGFVLARGLTRPLAKLTAATHSMAAGDLDQRVRVGGSDELGQLALSFNQMAAALAADERQRQQLFADIAHELRTPLSVLRGQLEAMLDGVLPLSPENLSLANEETILLGRLVDELRALSLAESGQLPLDRRPLDLGLVASNMHAAFAPLAEAEGIRLELAVAADLPRVLADEARLQQVLGNLLSNAVRHAGHGDAAQPQIHLAVTAPDQAGVVRVSVSDNGPGLTPEAQQHVFDRFWRADAGRSRDRGGSGLGLAISRGIVIAHGGRIWVESIPGQGAIFIFELPVAKE